ncbi:MAG: hypothetical protein QGI75_08245 [Phycisphaerales bacterium]|jgi:hypothetical protein|nr:hypothetical protein [Phycisphaerales bacterium]
MPSAFIIRLLGAFLLVSGGCVNDAGTPASPVQVSLSDSQAIGVRGVLDDGVPVEPGPLLPLLPASGVRWSDVERAVKSAGAEPEILFAVVSADVEPKTAAIYLRTTEGWPVVVRAHPTTGGIRFDAVVGPYPGDPVAQEKARQMERASMKSLREWGKKPAVSSWRCLAESAPPVNGSAERYRGGTAK